MKTHVQSIRLNPASTSGQSRLVKSAALTAFRALRTALEVAKSVPDIAAQASADVREAWEESSRPKP